MSRVWRSEDATKVTLEFVIPEGEGVKTGRREVIVPRPMEVALRPAIAEAAVESALGPWRFDWQITIVSIETIPGVTVAVERGVGNG